MLRIGDFSKITKVTIRMLRHYDQIGLFKPACVDPISGYRAYSYEQMPQLSRIVFLRDLGFTIQEIKSMVDNHLSIEEMETKLLKRKQELEEEIKVAQLNLGVVTERLKAIQHEQAIPSNDVTVKSVAPITVASVRKTVPHVSEMHEYCHVMYEQVYRDLERLHIEPAGPEVTFYHNESYSETDLDVEVSLIIRGSEEELRTLKGSSLTVRHLPAESEVATMVYNGPYDGMELAIIELLKWIARHGWVTTGEMRELHLSGPTHPDGELVERSIIEFQIPIDSHIM
jgi:DNA-binding transcriptional MerR regulator/effector-binding domain-containing protein